MYIHTYMRETRCPRGNEATHLGAPVAQVMALPGADRVVHVNEVFLLCKCSNQASTGLLCSSELHLCCKSPPG